MSQENVEVFKRGVEAYNRRDADALIDQLDPTINGHPAMHGGARGGTTVYRGHERCA